MNVVCSNQNEFRGRDVARNVFVKITKTAMINPQIITVNQIMSRISQKRGSISVIIRPFKSICQKKVNREYHHGKFIWQPRFNDHVVRSEKDLCRIRKYRNKKQTKL